ncbi:MAG TPA: hypothetical protein VJ161_04495, partial [Geobacteraceae bacterium]|nr:hypothetical protein [Geobacteraceae bacterium]
IPDSIRLLNPALPAGATEGFTNINPLTGQPITPPVTNTLFNFGWEYVWHCHILSHEENDMMRTIKLNVARQLPTAPVLTATGTGPVSLTWTDGTPAATSSGNPANEIGFRIERATGPTGAFAIIGTALANVTTYNDATAVNGTMYRYRVVAYNASGDSPSNIVTVGQPPIASPTNLTATINSPSQIRLSWTDASNNETSFAVWRSVNGSAFTQIGTVNRNANQRVATGGTVNFNNNGVTVGNTYAYYVTAVNATGVSAPSNTVTVVLAVPAAPTNLTGSAVRINGNLFQDRATLNWTDNSANETGFQIQRATSANFNNATSFSVGANVTTFSQNVSRVLNYYYRVRATSGVGDSGWSNAVFVTTP